MKPHNLTSNIPGVTTRLNIYTRLALIAAIAVLSVSAGCRKGLSPNGNQPIAQTSSALENQNIVPLYTGLNNQTTWELDQARAASARYRSLDNAIRDGYVDINVIRPNMGYHFLKSNLVDTVFDFRKPEILVYNKTHEGNFDLVAVEYAVPIAQMPDHAPAGFTGNQDVWKYDTDFGLWLLHAWVWAFNSSGVFSPTNPAIHVH